MKSKNILVILALVSVAMLPVIAKYKLRRDLRTDIADNLRISRAQSYLVYYITPKYREEAIKQVNAKVQKDLKKLSAKDLKRKKMLFGAEKYELTKQADWDNSDKGSVFVATNRYSLSEYGTHGNQNLSPIKSVNLVNEDYDIVCKPLSRKEVKMTGHILGYVDKLYHNQALGLVELNSAVEPNTMASVVEFSPKCFKNNYDLRVMIQSNLSKSAKSSVKDKLKDIIVEEFAL